MLIKKRKTFIQPLKLILKSKQIFFIIRPNPKRCWFDKKFKFLKYATVLLSRFLFIPTDIKTDKN